VVDVVAFGRLIERPFALGVHSKAHREPGQGRQLPEQPGQARAPGNACGRRRHAVQDALAVEVADGDFVAADALYVVVQAAQVTPDAGVHAGERHGVDDDLEGTAHGYSLK